MITIRDATPFHLTDQEIAELCGIDYRAEIEAAEREDKEWRMIAAESLRRIMERDGGWD